MSDKKSLGLQPLLAKINPWIATLRRFSFVLFLGLVVIIYGFIVLRINALSSAEPSNDSVTSQVQAAHVPHIDQKVVNQLESLHNNSVNVQALFNESRSNPFN